MLGGPNTLSAGVWMPRLLFFGVLFFSLPVEAEIRIDTSEDDLNSIAMAVSFKDGGRLEFVFLFQAPIFLVNL